MLKYATIIAVCLSFLATPAFAQWNMANDFVVPTPYPNPTNQPVEGDLWTYGNLSYPDSHQNFSINSSQSSVTGSADVIGWGAWQAGQTMQNQTGPWQPWNDDIWTDLGDLYIIPTSGRQLTDPITSSMVAQMFLAPKTGLYHVHGRFYGMPTGNGPMSSFDLFNAGPVKIVKGEYDHSDAQADYAHEMLHDGYINGSIAGGDYEALGPAPESSFDILVELTEGMPLIFAEGILDAHGHIEGAGNEDWDVMRFGVDASIDFIPEPSSLLLAFSGLLLVGFMSRRR